MKIVILHHDLENTEKELQKILSQKGMNSVLMDVRECGVDDFDEGDLVLNRVYASVANRDYGGTEKALELLKELEEKGINCVNSYKTTAYDYDKFKAYKIMKENGVLTPETILVNDNSSVDEAIKKFSFPLIVKRNTAGRGKDLAKCNTKEEVIDAIENIQKSEDYRGKIIIQKFLQPIEPKDCRVWVIGNKISFFHDRSLVSINEGEQPWLGSRSLGSKIFMTKGELPKELQKIALDSTKIIKADLNVMDIIKTDKGYVVIENNPTPNLVPEYGKVIGFDPIEFLYNQIIKIFQPIGK